MLTGLCNNIIDGLINNSRKVISTHGFGVPEDIFCKLLSDICFDIDSITEEMKRSVRQLL